MPGLLRSLSHPLTLILVLWSHSPMYDFCQETVIIDFCVTILSGRYSTLHASPTSSTELKKLNGWMDEMNGIGASDGLSVNWIHKMHPALSLIV